MKVAVEQFFNGTYAQTPIASYDSTKVNYGTLCRQANLSADVRDKYVGPVPNAAIFAAEAALTIPSSFVHPVQITSDLFWIFGNDAATAAATRRVQLWTYVPSTGVVTFMGAVTLTFPTATNHTVRGLRAVLTNITTGTVAVSGTAVTGSGTAFTTGISVGSRIGFGSTDPNQITTWYEISATGSATSITLTTSAGTIASNTPYVIQDLMLVTTTTNATTTNGGLFVAKGLRFENFQQPATTIVAATTVDKIRAVYWLKDAATVTNITAGGSAIDDLVSMTEQYVYVIDGAATTAKVFKYNFRAALTLTSGAATLSGTDLVITGNQTVTGNLSQLNNGRVATVSHGPGSGVKCLYLLTATRIIRAPISGITAASTTFVADSMSEVSPGGANTNVVAGTFVSFDVASSIDRFVITMTSGNGANYVTQYNTSGAQFDRRFGLMTNQLNSASRDTDSPIHPHFVTGSTLSVWCEGGIAFFTTTVITTNQNNIIATPLAADWSYASTSAQRIIAPAISISAAKLYRVYVNAVKNIGDEMMGVAPDSFRILYRTSGITDNTGAWTTVAEDGDLTAVGAVTSIQFAFEFRTMGVVQLPARIMNLVLLYEASDDLPAQYRWNLSDFNTGNGTFAWIQRALFGVSPTVHTINIYRADTDALVLTQASSGTTNGTFEFWNGSAWTAGLGTDTLSTRRRFVPTAGLPAGVSLYAVLTVA